MADIFVSYRRRDSAAATGRLADRLEAHFGVERVFMDRNSIVAGDDFTEVIRRAIATATVMLAVVGPRWSAAATADGARRLDDPADHVRREIETALAAGVTVVPVLVEGATMPSPSELPPSLAAFARCHAFELSDARWHDDVARLIALLQERFAVESVRPRPAGGGASDGPSAAVRLVADLVDLAIHPRRLIARRQSGHASDHARALAFLVLAVATGNLALLFGLGYRPPAGDTFGGVLAMGTVFGLLGFVLAAALLAFAWRLAGVRAAGRRVWLVGAYLYGGAWLGACVGALLLGTSVLLIDASLFERVLGLLRLPAGEAPAEAWAEVERRIAAGMSGPRVAVFVLANTIWLGTLAWVVVAWGAFRDAFGVGRIRSVLALLVWVGLLGMFWTLVGWLG